MIRVRLRHIVLAGVACALVAVAGGFALEWIRLGASDEAAFARVEQDVRGRFDDILSTLKAVSASVADPDIVERAASSAVDAQRLMDATEVARRGRTEDVVAVTVFSADNRPLAWHGLPSEILPDRLEGPETVFIAPESFGARLVHVRPVVTGSPARRVGTVGTEWALAARTDALAGAEVIRFNSLVPLTLRARYQGAGASPRPNRFVIAAPTGETLLEATASAEDLAAARRNWRRGVANLVLAIAAVMFVLVTGPILSLRRVARSRRTYLGLSVSLVGVLALARTLLWLAATGPWTPPPLFDLPPGHPAAALFLRSTVDFLLSSLGALALVVIAVDSIDRARLVRDGPRRLWQWQAASLVPFTATQFAAGLLVAALVRRYQHWLIEALVATPLDVAHFSLHPLDAPRLTFAVGLVALHVAVVWAAALLLQAATLPWRISWRSGRTLSLLIGCWVAGLSVVLVFGDPVATPRAPTAWATATALALTLAIGRGRTPYRHASQGLRLVVGALAAIVPALGMYPTALTVGIRATDQIVETEFGPEALNLRRQVQDLVTGAREQIDRIPDLDDFVSAPGTPASRAAYTIWSRTDLAEALLTSSVELYGMDGSVVSRFAFNLPEDPGFVGEWTPQGCNWEIYEEVSPFGSDERRVLFAGRGLCRDDRPVGAIVIRATFDYDALSFISARSLPVEGLRTANTRRQEGYFGRDVEFVVYGWSRRPIYASADLTWTIDDPAFDRLAMSRDPFWVTATTGDREYAVYLPSDRAAIYAVGYPRLTRLEHVINLAEITVLAAILYLLLLTCATLFSRATGFGPASGRALLREIRASFYRKLFLAFVLASIVPVGTLAFVLRAFIATQADSTLQAAAARTAATAQRVIEDLQRDAAGLPNLDDLMVGISRAIGQEVDVFDGPSVWATSKRFLYESRLLPERAPSTAYRAITLERRSSFVDREAVDGYPYRVAAAPIRLDGRSAMLTVPLTLRQQQSERDVDALDRRILLAGVLFVLLGAAIGYSMAERIADPVNRLTRATRRIARGDLDARVVETSSDELRTLIAAFNRMAAELRHQRAELERSHRIAAWAEMARQVAHEIKNPLTPIQLSAEHLMRIHDDRGKPLSPVLEECLTVVLSQVRLLRQIASEFSTFASSPTAHPVPCALAALVREVVSPYRTGLAGRVRIDEEVPDDLPLVHLDRTLFQRALANVIENALHALPGEGTITISAVRAGDLVRLAISDTGEGMEADALERVFEPYFSTKTSGTGLGLPIAKRNVELSGGRISIDSRKGGGTTVTIELPT